MNSNISIFEVPICFVQKSTIPKKIRQSWSGSKCSDIHVLSMGVASSFHCELYYRSRLAKLQKRRERKWKAWGSVLCREFAQKRPGYENCEIKHCRKEGRRLSEQFSKPVPSLHNDITAAAAARRVELLAMSATSTSMRVVYYVLTQPQHHTHGHSTSQSLLEFCARGTNIFRQMAF